MKHQETTTPEDTVMQPSDSLTEKEEATEAERLDVFLAREHELAGDVTTLEALDILSRFNASHFQTTDREHARYSIPAEPRRDDDIRLAAFIARAHKAFRRVEALEKTLTILAEHEPSWTDDFCRARAALGLLKVSAPEKTGSAP